MTISIPQLWMPKVIFDKFFAYIDVAQGEVGGLGELELADGKLFVRDVHLFRQKTTDAETVLDQQAHSKFMREMMALGKDISAYRLWWHSHALYNVGWSKDKDEVTIRTLSKRNYLVSIVGNKHHDLATRYDLQTPEVVSIHGFSIYLYDDPDAKSFSMDEIRAEVAEKVTYVPSKSVKVVVK